MTTTFSSLLTSKLISSNTAKAIKHVEMTLVQQNTIIPCLNGLDVLAQAKTGTGKTLAFLIPAIERILKSKSTNQIKTLIIAPTRDLCIQISNEANDLLKFHNFTTLSIFGGTNVKMDKDVSRMTNKMPAIVIACPGRLIDILQNSKLGASYFNTVDCLILDEADRLLDQGFLPDIEKIVSKLPKNRQTLMFSATISNKVKQVAKFSLKDSHQFIQCIDENDTPTHEKINQFLHIVNDDLLFESAFEILKRHISASKKPKIIVFLPTARLAQLAAELFSNITPSLSIPILEIHSRLSASKRERNCQEFKTQDSVVIFSSDVIARGMDFPLVNLVLQMGCASNREQYLHRIGRTGRADSEGKAVLLLTRMESNWCNHIKDLVTETDLGFQQSKSVSLSMGKVTFELKSQAYVSWLGFYNGMKGQFKLSSQDLVDSANSMAYNVFYVESIPAVSAKAAGLMGLKNVKGLVIEGRNGGNDSRGVSRGGNAIRGKQTGGQTGTSGFNRETANITQGENIKTRNVGKFTVSYGNAALQEDRKRGKSKVSEVSPKKTKI